MDELPSLCIMHDGDSTTQNNVYVNIHTSTDQCVTAVELVVATRHGVLIQVCQNDVTQFPLPPTANYPHNTIATVATRF